MVDTHSPAYPSAFGRGWIPQARDIGLPPGEAPADLNSAGANGAGACPPTNHNAWTPRRKAAFLHFLAETGNVRAAAARVGISFQSAYVMRRRDPVFGEGWAAALVLARDHVEQVLATRALDGVEEGVYYHGQPVAVRRRYDGRLLLAHLARLDQLAYETRAGDAALRFDELLALVAGEQPHEDMIDFGGGDPDAAGPVLPLARETYAETAAIRAQHRAEDDDDDGDDPEADRFEGEGFDEADADGGAPAPDEPGYWDYHAVALADWDAWQAHAFATVDALAAGFADDGEEDSRKGAEAQKGSAGSQARPCSDRVSGADTVPGEAASPRSQDPCAPAPLREPAENAPPMEFKSLAFLRPEPRQLRQPTARAARSDAGLAGVRNALAGEALG